MNLYFALRYLAACARSGETASLPSETYDELVASGYLAEGDATWSLTPAARHAMREMGRPS